MSQQEDQEDEKIIRQWRVKKLVQGLERARGNGTSMISLVIPPKDQVSRYSKMLADEFGTASNIKNRVNRLSVLSAITSTQQKLKLYNHVPENGLVIYCGTIVTDEGKEKKVNIDFEPHKPINTSLYLCDNRFHTEPLQDLLQSDEKYGFIVMDGSGTLYGTLCGNTRAVLHKFSVDLPKKHGRGGQSAMRFQRLRDEKRHNYVRKVAEFATQIFITNDRPNVSGLILAGLADFKTFLGKSDLFDGRLKEIILQVLDVSYGGENGFNQAIELASETLKNTKFVKEKKLISEYFENIAKDTGKFCFGIKDTMHALEQGASRTLIIFENLDLDRIEVRNLSTGEESILYLSEEQQRDPEAFKDSTTGDELEVISKQSVVEWFADNYKSFGTKLEFVTDRSQEGSQFLNGFGGIGCLLRWKVDFDVYEDSDDDIFEY